MQIYQLCTGEAVHCYQQSIVVRFTGKKQVLSTGPHNGGLRDDITAVFNNDGTVGVGMPVPLLAASYAEHVATLADRLGLDGDTATGFVTAAQMENASIKTVSYKALTVTAIVTAGVEVNGARVGDPAPWDEFAEAGRDGKPETLGTINIMLFFNVNLTPDALVRSLVTCTEAKAAALQELMTASRYSSGLATGSGTDGTIVVADAESSLCLENAGKQCKLGELIGVAVKAAVKEALFRQSGLCPELQKNVLRRVERYGITAESLWQELKRSGRSDVYADKAKFWQRIERLFDDEKLVTQVSLYVHLLDQLNWGLLSLEAVRWEAAVLLAEISAGESCELSANGTDSGSLVRDLQRVLVGALLKKI